MYDFSPLLNCFFLFKLNEQNFKLETLTAHAFTIVMQFLAGLFFYDDDDVITC